jgi:ParB-like chromosome segregation protein Spo0J
VGGRRRVCTPEGLGATRLALIGYDVPVTHGIVEALLPLATPVDDLKLLGGNPRRGDVEAVAKSLDRFGQRKPVVVNVNTGEVTAGNHTVEAARLLGWDQVAAVMIDDDPATAGAFALADNRTADLAVYDEEALADLVREVMEVDAGLLEAASFSADDLDDLLADLADTADVGQLGDPAKRPNEREADWDQSAIRSILLSFDFARYAWMLRQLAALRAEMKADSNAEVVLALVADATSENPPVEVADA